MAIRYVAVPFRLAAGSGGGPEYPPPPSVPSALAAQIDLRQVPSDPSLLVYENAAWGPLRAELAPGTGGGASKSATLGADLSGARPVLPGRRSQLSFRGPVAGDADVYLADASRRWN